MRRNKFWLSLLPFYFLVMCFSAGAQLPPAQPDPLARIREAAPTDAPACSVTGESLCEQVAPKIIANAQGESPLTENLHRLANEVGGSMSGPRALASAVDWGVSAFREAGLDVHTEKYAISTKSPPAEQKNVVAEIRGREKPEEWVLLGARLNSCEPRAEDLNNGCSAALVVEAARDILLTGIRPRRSIRFVLFTGEAQEMLGSWAYVRAHRSELDHAGAVIILDGRIGRVNGFMLNGRRDIEAGVREALKPLESWGVTKHMIDAPLGMDNFDFLLEGVPTLIANQEKVNSLPNDDPASDTFSKVDVQQLKRNTAIAAVAAFGIAENALPLGSRQSRGEIQILLKTSGLGEQMKVAGLWPLWESGERGQVP
jgi:hypothetical protein